MKKIAVISFLLISVFFANAQKSVNDYKYVIVPHKFDFLQEADKYRVNTQTRFLFKKNGFSVVYDNEKFPQDLAFNNCLALKANVLNVSGLFKTKLKVELRDCYNNLVFVSDEGVSKKKVYKEAYREALTAAFKSVETLNYSYNGKQGEHLLLDKPTKKEIPTTVVKEDVSEAPKSNNTNGTLLKATAVSNGYIIKNSKGEVVYEIIRSLQGDVYFITNKQGILYKQEGNRWVREYLKDGKPSAELIIIDF